MNAATAAALSSAPKAAVRPRVSPLQLCVLVYGVIAATNVAVHFPYDTDPQTTAVSGDPDATEFYRQAYAASPPRSNEDRETEEVYVRIAQRAAEAAHVKARVTAFVNRYGLHDKRILDIGAGRGYLQDVVPDYTGLDISPTAQRYFHKPFVLASATAMPFKDHEFDAVWTVWVLEHVPNPEAALREMRRVVKPGGLIFLMPAWLCPAWAADGYEVRPYSDFGLAGKLVKASVLVRRKPGFQFTYTVPIRTIRRLYSAFANEPTRFHYRRLSPNYHRYWVPDSDAVNSMDPDEAVLWFESRGDQCLSCAGGIRSLISTPVSVIIRVSAN